jgi:NTE family protein
MFDFLTRGGKPGKNGPTSPRRPPKLGLALGSGAARGFAHVGVLRALAEIGVKPDIVVGTSIGAVAGAAYASGLIDTLEGYARKIDARLMLRLLDLNLGGGGLMAGSRLGGFLTGEFGERRIEDLKPAFACVATELATGNESWLRSGPLVPAIRASSAIPGILQPVAIDGRWMVDGALVNPVPVSVCRAMGAEAVIAVSLSADFFSRSNSVRSTGQDGADLTVPSLADVVIQAFSIAEDRITRSRLAGDPPDILIGPKVGHIMDFDFQRGAEAIDLGRDATLKAAAHLRALAGV